MLFKIPLCIFAPIPLEEANEALQRWEHKIGALHRGNQGAICHGLYHEDRTLGASGLGETSGYGYGRKGRRS